MGLIVHLSGKVRLYKNKVLVVTGPNLVTVHAYEEIAKFLTAEGTTLPSHIAVGTGSTIPDPSQTVLDDEIVRAALSKSRVGRQVTYTATVSVTATILECGIFDAAAAGNMFARFLTGEIVFLAGDELDVEWELTVGDIV